MSTDRKPDQKPERTAGTTPPAERGTPAAGPHDRPELTNPDATPGTGMLPEPSDKLEDGDMQPSG
jgi:hypothetical protein